jgi:hypothetical protein
MFISYDFFKHGGFECFYYLPDFALNCLNKLHENLDTVVRAVLAIAKRYTLRILPRSTKFVMRFYSSPHILVEVVCFGGTQ